MELGIYPDVLKTVKVIALHKNGSKLDLGNYRPISILSPINKVFETTQTMKNTISSNYQFGFRKQHSTIYAITFLNETVLNELDYNIGVCAIFLDFAKAFNCVNHEVFISKLEHHGVRGSVLSLLHSCSSNGLQYTENR